MKVVQINATCGVGSTGKICVGISQILSEKNIENFILYNSKTNGDEHGIRCSNSVYLKAQALKSRIIGNYGFNSKLTTRKIVKELERIRPDLVHLHNIHGHDCNLERLFAYFRKHKTKLLWTFHDCWAFTAYCPHFAMAECDKWKTQCSHCVLRNNFSWFFDKSRNLFERKRKAFSEQELTIVTPSCWLASVVKQSFLKEYPVEVIHNGVDLNIFKPTVGDFRRRHHLDNQKIVLGVSFLWDEHKGIDVFVELARRLPSDYQIVLVGTNETTDKMLPCSILSVHRTQNQQELAEIYSASDVFVNPTREEVLGLVNIEALACGTPGITFRSGGSPECYDETCGSVVDCDDVDAMEREIIRICTEKPYSKEACITKAKEFDKNERFKEYIELYERIITAGTEGN